MLMACLFLHCILSYLPGLIFSDEVYLQFPDFSQISSKDRMVGRAICRLTLAAPAGYYIHSCSATNTQTQ